MSLRLFSLFRGSIYQQCMFCDVPYSSEKLFLEADLLLWGCMYVDEFLRTTLFLGLYVDELYMQT